MEESVALAPEPSYSVGDLVWAKMKGFSPWPGRVARPPADLKLPKKVANSQCIYFFGTNNYGWIEEVNIKPYHEFKDQLIKSSKSNAFKEAVAQIEEYIVDPEKFAELEAVKDNNEEFDKLKDGDGEAENQEPAAKKKNTTPKVKPVKRSSSAGLKSGTPRKRIKKEMSRSYTDPDTDNDTRHSTVRHTYKTSSTLLDRPSNTQRPETPPLNLARISDTLRGKNIEPSQSTFGFLGLGIMGCGIVKNLLNSGHKVVVWNRTSTKCKEFEKVGATVADTPSDVVEVADITYSCVSDPQAAKEMVFGNCGVLHCATLQNKGYVEMTSIDPDTSNDIVEAVTNKGGRYLEVQLQGSKTQAEEGSLIVLAAGDHSLFLDCQSCFQAIGKSAFFFGAVGNASKMNSVLQLLSGVSLAAMAEGLALADRAGLQQQDLLDVLALTQLASPLLILKGRAMIDSSYSTHQPLTHMQKDLKVALSLGDTLEQSLPLTATTNEIFKHAKRLGYSNHDVSAVYIRARF